jgi:hypothetical protein
MRRQMPAGTAGRKTVVFLSHEKTRSTRVRKTESDSFENSLLLIMVHAPLFIIIVFKPQPESILVRGLGDFKYFLSAD